MHIRYDRDKLFFYLRETSIQYGSFKMAGGQTSSILIDLSTSLRTSEGQKHLTDCVAYYLPKDIICGGPISGSDLVCSSLAMAGVCSKWFGIRKEPKERGFDQGKITGNLEKGDKVWIVEDVCTTGQTMRNAIECVLDHGCFVEGLFSVVDRGGLVELSKEFSVKGISIFHLSDFH